MLFNGRNDGIDYIEGYGSMIFEANKWLLKNKQGKAAEEYWEY